MKEFIFNQNQMCINPNRVEIGNKTFWLEIQTACHEGKWYHGHQYYAGGETFELDVYLNTGNCDTEAEAVCKEIDCLLHWLNQESERRFSSLEVPDSIFRQLKDLKEKYRTPQLSLDF